MKRKISKEIEEEASGIEKKAIYLIDQYGPKIRDKKFWEDGNKYLSGTKIYVPHGGSHPRPKPHFERNPNWQYDSPEFLAMKGFLEKYPEYQTRNARSVRDWYGV